MVRDQQRVVQGRVLCPGRPSVPLLRVQWGLVPVVW